MKPDPNFKLFLGNCLDVMQDFADESIDIVFTSPPYNCGMPYKNYDDNLSDDDFYQFLVDFMFACDRIMADQSRLYIVCTDKMLFDLVEISQCFSINFSQVLVWCKPNLSGGSFKISGDWNYLTEFIPLFRKGKRTKMINSNVNTHNFFVIPSPQTNYVTNKKLHIAQFPLELPRRILARTPGTTVLDPFMGSGTTGVACVELGKNFIGIDIDPFSVELAKSRINESQSQFKLGLVL